MFGVHAMLVMTAPVLGLLYDLWPFAQKWDRTSIISYRTDDEDINVIV